MNKKSIIINLSCILIIAITIIYIVLNNKEKVEKIPETIDNNIIKYECTYNEATTKLQVFVDDKFYENKDYGTTTNSHLYIIEYNKREKTIHTSYELTIQYTNVDGFNLPMDLTNFMDNLAPNETKNQQKLIKNFVWEGLQLFPAPDDISDENWIKEYIKEIEKNEYKCSLK